MFGRGAGLHRGWISRRKGQGRCQGSGKSKVVKRGRKSKKLSHAKITLS